MRRSNRGSRRRGATVVETALVLPVFLILVLGMIDLGIGVFRQGTLSQAARQGARKAAVHGKQAPSGWDGGPWGVAAIDQPLTATGVPVVDAVKPMLASCPAADTRVLVEWPQGTNATGSSVRVTVTSDYTPLITFIFGNPRITLRATSTMLISH